MIMLVTLLLILKICLSVEINFWKTPLKITVKNLRSFQGTYLWRSSILVKALSLRFTVIFLMILKLMVLRNFIIILSALTGNFFFLCLCFCWLFIPFTVLDYNYSIILLFCSITGYLDDPSYLHLTLWKRFAANYQRTLFLAWLNILQTKLRLWKQTNISPKMERIFLFLNHTRIVMIIFHIRWMKYTINVQAICYCDIRFTDADINGQAVFMTHVFSQTLKYKIVILKENLNFIWGNHTGWWAHTSDTARWFRVLLVVLRYKRICGMSR